MLPVQRSSTPTGRLGTSQTRDMYERSVGYWQPARRARLRLQRQQPHPQHSIITVAIERATPVSRAAVRVAFAPSTPGASADVTAVCGHAIPGATLAFARPAANPASVCVNPGATLGVMPGSAPARGCPLRPGIAAVAPLQSRAPCSCCESAIESAGRLWPRRGAVAARPTQLLPPAVRASCAPSQASCVLRLRA